MKIQRHIGLNSGARAWFIAGLTEETSHLCVIVKNHSIAEELKHDLEFFLSDIPIRTFTGWETIPFEFVSPQLDISATRLAVLDELRNQSSGIIIATAEALMQRVVPPTFFDSLCFTLRPGDLVERSVLEARFAACGFQAVSLVEEVGEVAVHGKVIDFFPALSPAPLRVEFAEGRIAAIRAFDSDSQRSLYPLASARVLPVREWTDGARVSQFQERVDEALERLKERGRALETPAREIARAMGEIRSGTYVPGIELYNGYLCGPLVSFLDYLSPSHRLVVQLENSLKHALDSLWQSVSEREERLAHEHYLIPPKQELFFEPDEILAALGGRSRHVLDQLEDGDEGTGLHSTRTVHRTLHNTELSVRVKSQAGSGEALKPLQSFITTLRRNAFSLCFIVGSASRAERLQRMLLSIDIDARILDLPGQVWLNSPQRYPVVILQGQLSHGFQLPEHYVAFVAEHEIFAERSYRKSGRSKTSLKRLLGSLAQLREGNYVVHVDFGIGLYRGLKHLEVDGGESDFLHIEYADSRLYLPVHNIGKVQKFQAAEGQTPALDKLASTRWVKTKLKVREAVATLAGDLIKLYATRSIAKGWRFEPYGSEDENFAEEFPYDETPDQLSAIKDTLKDLASERPMDRLVCGDVGFGKTEVAVRAAFKCFQHGRQTAVLVPTTILAEQHKRTFTNRFSHTTARVGAVSRFYSSEQNRRTLADLQSGNLDIVVGTHRLLSRDVVFKDLGLLIIDEEHRFGVKQKERLKSLRANVDILTLTATPIPRTLHMSLLNIRDISVISSPPHDRRLIRSYVASFDETLIRDAIMRELQRGGQSFFVHNKVNSIDAVTARLQALIPEGRFRYAHGQMSETQLEDIMQQFLDHEIDVLVCTTIIESGIDIPNANTMLIDRADQFGLAQLYQLRGRVGRSDRQAYAYFLIPKSRKLGNEAHRRLKALQALDDLGMGFNLALRDMEIRGAGNLLGKEQSGNVLAIGFELYSKILQEAVLNLKGEEPSIREMVDPEIKLGVRAYIPEHYVPDVSERLILYQRFAGIESEEETDTLLSEVQDRFGPFDRETRNLAEIMRLRCILRSFGVVKLELHHARLVVGFSPNAPVDASKILQLVKKHPDQYRFSKHLTLSVAWPTAVSNPAEIIEPLRELLVSIRSES